METPVLYIVVPCYNEQDALASTNGQLMSLIDEMASEGLIAGNSRVLYVNDGSRDGTWALIEGFCASQERACGVSLAANSGHQNALLAGLNVAKGHADIMVSIDADLQDDVHAIPAMVKKYREGCDIVYGVRNNRSTDTWFKRSTAQGFYRLMHKLGVRTVYNHADFRLMSRRAVEQLCKYRERNLFLRGIVPLIGYKASCVYYDRQSRLAGHSKYPLSKMLNFAIDGITSFSIRPVRLIFFLGLIFLLIALFILIYVLHQWWVGSVVPGWSSLMLSIWFVGGCILVGLGVTGEYVGKIYIETKDRPRYNIEKTLIK